MIHDSADLVARRAHNIYRHECFIDAGYFRTAGAQAFLRTCKFAGLDLAVLEVVFDEVRGNFEKGLSSSLISLTKAERQVARFVTHESDEISLDDETERFDENPEESLQDVGGIDQSHLSGPD
jgi:predicted aminopeptidase